MKEFPIVLRSLVESDFVESIFVKDKIDYGLLEQKVLQVFTQLKTTMMWPNASFSKYRISANLNWFGSNATDAAFLHRDLIHVTGDPIESYTLVLYMDKATLRYIKDSEYQICMPFLNFMTETVRRQDFQAGDAILFNSHMLHAACNVRQSRRCVIQLFNICPNALDMCDILDVCAGESLGLSKLLNNFMLLNANNGIIRFGSELCTSKNYYVPSTLDLKNFKSISAEARCRRLTQYEYPDDLNLYVAVNTSAIDEKKRREIRWILHARCYLIACFQMTCAAAVTISTVTCLSWFLLNAMQ